MILCTSGRQSKAYDGNTPTRRVKRRRRENRGAKDAEGVGCGEGCPLPLREWVYNERAVGLSPFPNNFSIF